MSDDVTSLCGIIQDGSREDVWEAAKKLESIVIDAESSLLRVLADGKHADARAAAAYVLGFGRFASARTTLENVLDNAREEVFVRGHAAEALAYIGDPRSTYALMENLQDDDPGVKYWCLFALGQIAEPRALSALRRFAESGEDQCYEGRSLRAEALGAIAEIERRAK
jgi:HEAT repeat protein